MLFRSVKTTNSVVSFLKEILPECKWDLLPATDFLYAAYKKWYSDFVPSGKVIGRNDFIDSVREFAPVDSTSGLRSQQLSTMILKLMQKNPKHHIDNHIIAEPLGKVKGKPPGSGQIAA